MRGRGRPRPILGRALRRLRFRLSRKSVDKWIVAKAKPICRRGIGIHAHRGTRTRRNGLDRLGDRFGSAKELLLEWTQWGRQGPVRLLLWRGLFRFPLGRQRHGSSHRSEFRQKPLLGHFVATLLVSAARETFAHA